MASSVARVFARRKSCSSYNSELVAQQRAGFHASTRRSALSVFNMPAMSPTMTEGGIASWKKQEGESFAQGDVLLEIVRRQQCLP